MISTKRQQQHNRATNTNNNNNNNNYSVRHKIAPPLILCDIFSKAVNLGIFIPIFTHLLYISIYARLQSFMQSPTVTKSRHIKRDHHYMLKMSTLFHVVYF